MLSLCLCLSGYEVLGSGPGSLAAGAQSRSLEAQRVEGLGVEGSGVNASSTLNP